MQAQQWGSGPAEIGSPQPGRRLKLQCSIRHYSYRAPQLQTALIAPNLQLTAGYVFCSLQSLAALIPYSRHFLWWRK
eukprot:scaffold307216_cov20-Prasinocladus_malaysianus.AAC.1